MFFSILLVTGQVKTGSDDLVKMHKSTGNNGTSEHPVNPSVDPTTLSADNTTTSNNNTSHPIATIHDGAVETTLSANGTTTLDNTTAIGNITTPNNNTSGVILTTPNNNTSGGILTTPDNNTSGGEFTTPDNTTSEGTLTTHDNNTIVGETTGMPVLHTDISTPLPVATTRTPASHIKSSTPGMDMSTDEKGAQITTPVSTGITDVDNTTKTSLVHIQTNERPNEPVHSKSGKSLALGITIPLLIVIIVIGVIWIRR